MQTFIHPDAEASPNTATYWVRLSDAAQQYSTEFKIVLNADDHISPALLLNAVNYEQAALVPDLAAEANFHLGNAEGFYELVNWFSMNNSAVMRTLMLGPRPQDNVMVIVTWSKA